MKRNIRYMMKRKLYRTSRHFLAFFQQEAAGGILLFLGALFALVWANSAFGTWYEEWLHLPVRLGIGEWSLSFSLLHWINDGLMTIFFFVIGMEIKREVSSGELKSLQASLLPVIAAVFGMIMPALIYLFFNWQQPSMHGWGIPMATDIAFALGVLSLAGQGISAADHGQSAADAGLCPVRVAPHPVSDPRGDAGGGAAHRLAGDDQRADHSDAAVSPAAPDCPLVHTAQAATRGGALSRRPVAVCAGGYRHLVALDSGGDPPERRGVHPLPLAQCADRSDGAWSFEGELFRGGLHLRTRGGHGGLAGRLGAGPLGRELALRPDGAALPGDPDALWSEYPDLAHCAGPGRALTARRSAPCRRPESIGPARGGCLSLCPRQGVAG